MAGTIGVDIDALIDVLKYVSAIKKALDDQKALVPSLDSRVDAAITGTARNRLLFDIKFDSWALQLNVLTGEMDEAYRILSQVLQEAENAVNAL